MIARRARSPARVGRHRAAVLRRVVRRPAAIADKVAAVGMLVDAIDDDAGRFYGTPHEMPVPAKELGVKGQALYTWGGTGAANSVVP